MTEPPSPGWRTDLPAIPLLLILLTGVLAMRYWPTVSLPLVLGMFWGMPPQGGLIAKLGLRGDLRKLLAALKLLPVIYLTGMPLMIAWHMLLQYLEIPFAWHQPVVELLRTATGRQLVVGLFFILIIAPVLEEILFRRILYDLLSRRLGSCGSTLLTSALFAAAHFFLLGFPMLMVCGIFFQRAALRNGSLSAAMLLHAAFNAVGVAMIAVST